MYVCRDRTLQVRPEHGQCFFVFAPPLLQRLHHVVDLHDHQLLAEGLVALRERPIGVEHVPLAVVFHSSAFLRRCPDTEA